jgi:hypothetical protein
MAKDRISEYSATNSANTVVGDIDIDEGCLPSTINNAIREVMTHLKEFEDGTNGITKLSAIDAEITGTGAIKVPVGTTAQRPTPATGQLRFNSTDSSFEGYDGSAWGAIGGGAENSFTVFEYTATASQTTFSGADDNAATLAYTAGNIQVMLNGVVLDPSDYTATNGTSVVLASGAALNDVLNIYAFTSFTVADTVPASTGGTFSANVAVTGDLTVDTNTLYVDSTNNRVGIKTTSPSAALHILDTSTPQAKIAYDSNRYMNVEHATIYNVSGAAQSNNLKFATRGNSGNNNITFFTGGTDASGTSESERLRITSAGNVGIGTSSPQRNLQVHKAAADSSFILLTNSTTGSSASNGLRMGVDGNGYSYIYNGANTHMAFATNDTERLRIDSSGNLLVSKTSANSTTDGIELRGGSGAVRFIGKTDSNAVGYLNRGVSDGDILQFAKDNSAVGSISAWSSSLLVGTGDVGLAFVDGTPERVQPRKADDQTSADGLIDLGHTSNRFKDLYLSGKTFISDGGSANPAYTFGNDTDTGIFRPTGNQIAFTNGGSESARIDSSRRLLIGKTTASSTGTGHLLHPNSASFAGRDNGIVYAFNRNGTDGGVIQIMNSDVVEGTISVSGTTVTYGGGHLARWSRLSDDSKDTSIVKGTVMTNLDAMVEWGDEDNEQLNKTAVSSVEGDVNVAGVFVSWDDDDERNDFYVAMTGDMIIRIASGTTVARGDLLMSAGDGTAKPQGDDIVRSKTIAKVTSTNVSHTYDDGSYCVPCVLMAC